MIPDTFSSSMDKIPNNHPLEKLVYATDREEVNRWLTRGAGQHYIGEMTPEDSLALVQHLYGLGAVEVFVAEISSNAGLSSTDCVVAVLPEDKNQRKAIFSWNNARIRLMGLDPDEDHGMSNLLVLFD